MDVTSTTGTQFSDATSPYSITDLAQTGKRLGEATRLHIGSVYITSLEGNRLKRPEVTLVRDLEYLRIYDTRSGKVTASYPDSAPWFHLCAPHCISIKQSNGRMRRLMWTAVSSHLPADRNNPEKTASAALNERRKAEGNWLRCVTDYVGQDELESANQQKARSEETVGVVSCLESIVLAGKVFLLAGYDNGLLAAYTEDLRVSNSPMADTMMGERIISMTTVNAERATNGILSSVRNIHTALDGSRLLVIISKLGRPNNAGHMRVRVLQLAIQASSPDRPFGTVLLTQDLSLNRSVANGFACRIYDGGQLNVWGGRTIQQFDLSKPSDRALHTIDFEGHVTSVLRLDQRSIAVCTTTGFDQINLDFHTSQAAFKWPEPLKQSEITKQYDSALIDYDKKSRLLLCLYGSRIITIGINGKLPTSIADFIDQGLSQTSETAKYQLAAYEAHINQNPRGEVKWNDWISHVVSLSKCVMEKNNIEFDLIFSKLLEFITSSIVGDQLENISLSPSQSLSNDEKLSTIVSYILEPVFDKVDHTTTFSLKIKILPERTFHWLVRNGYLTSSRIEHSFRRIGKINTESIQEAAIVAALAAQDINLTSLQYFITHDDALTAVEASSTISFVIASRREPIVSDIQAITAGNDMQIDELPDTHVVTKDVDQSVHQSANDEESTLIKIALLRLLDKDHSAIIKALRSQLTNVQLFALIEYLRTEMSKQGWFVEVLYASAYTGHNGEVQQTITRLAKILGCVLDALGMAPWLNTATSVENENLIVWMKLEISAALEAVEEATYMSGILNEVSLFTKLLNFPDKDRSQQGSRRIEPVAVDDGLMGSNALPAGLKPAGYIDINVVKAGKVQKMSSRQIGHMKSKMVGAYSREKIDLSDFYQPPMQQNGKRKR